MSDFLERLKDDAETVWNKAKETFEQEAAAENQELQQYHDLFAWADGSLIATPFTQSEVPDKDRKMKTVAVMKIKDQELKAPCSGTVEKIEPKNNTIVLDTGNGLTAAVKVCVGSISFEKDADILVRPGQKVAAGQTMVRFGAPIEAKSKLMAVSADSLEDFAKSGYAAAVKPGQVHQGDLIIHKG